VIEPGDKEHQFGGLVACVVGAMTEVQACAPQRTRTAIDGGADGLSGGIGGFTCGTDGVSGCVG
jgi:hypothetical protein